MRKPRSPCWLTFYRRPSGEMPFRWDAHEVYASVVTAGKECGRSVVQGDHGDYAGQPQGAAAVHAQRTKAAKCTRILREKGYAVPGTEKVARAPEVTSVRYFHAGDRPKAEEIAALLKREWADEDPQVMPVKGLEGRVPAGQFEIWFRLPLKRNPQDGLTYVSVPAGTFQMGCSEADRECFANEKPTRSVTISRDFWIGQTEVTQAAYEKIMRSNPSFAQGPDLPVEQVTWGQAKAYCEAAGGGLPTEAEWEYGARGGSRLARYGPVNDVAWQLDSSGNETHPVKAKSANGYGLYDMLGNVWEWTADWYSDYTGGDVTDPHGPANGPYRVVRGGAFDAFPRAARVSHRFRLGMVSYKAAGFRCVLK